MELSPPSRRIKSLSSHDEQISAFVSEISTPPRKKRPGEKSLLFIAISEMILAAFLAVTGLAILAPSIVGFSSQTQLVAYFDQVISGISVQSLSGPVIPAVEFILAVCSDWSLLQSTTCRGPFEKRSILKPWKSEIRQSVGRVGGMRSAIHSIRNGILFFKYATVVIGAAAAIIAVGYVINEYYYLSLGNFGFVDIILIAAIVAITLSSVALVASLPAPSG